MVNVAIQFFSFERSRKVLELIRSVDPLVADLPRRKFMFQSLDGVRRSISVSKLIDSQENEVRFNEGYLQTPIDGIRNGAPLKGIQEIIVHLSVSPTCELWQRPSEVAGTPAATHVIARNVASVERAAKNRFPRLMPTVLELTLKTNRADIPAVLKECSEIVGLAWPSVQCSDKTAVIDVGGEWLFFPKSGYNPNVSDLHLYFLVDTFESWPEARTRHNVSFASDSDGEHAVPTVHDTAPRRQSHA
jgi:hypothetical protein